MQIMVNVGYVGDLHKVTTTALDGLGNHARPVIVLAPGGIERRITEAYIDADGRLVLSTESM